ncbi:MAG: hypothetical protein ACD_39C01427G0002 [uncultured bacterium]|nr:MAG: hypothetical protein ACD_39C01427G0002 [uncultured bacterium]
MEIKQVTIELNEETIRRLEEKALKAGKNPELLAADLIKTGLNKEPEPPDSSKMPGVAMLKDNFEPVLSVAGNAGTGPGLLKNFAGPVSGPVAPDLPPERMRRKAEIEAKMRELSLVIDTAAEADKEKYAMQYAILAAELDALV